MKAGTCTIREAQVSDLIAVAQLCKSWEAEETTRNYRADTAAGLRKRLGECFLVAESAGEVIGFVIGEVKATKGNEFVKGVLDDQPSYLEVQDLYVAQPHRDGGIGTALAKELLARAAKRGVRNSLVYSANRDYRRTGEFYEKLGYEMWHVHMTRRA